MSRLWKRETDLKITKTLTLGKGTELKVNHSDNSVTTINLGGLASRVQERTASGAIDPGMERLTLNHATVAVVTTIADASKHAGYFCILNNSASGTAAHTVTLTSGTFNGTNNVATLNAPNEMLLVHFDSSGNGVVVLNTGSVVLS